ncbi:MAG TPA: response regulator, partial [Noviherbaspirillum sp.]|nr:response regulator [Noviherbaspirillum sp.]
MTTIKPTEVESSKTGLPHRRILVVDDNPDSADTLAMLIQMLGAEVRVARNGPAALAQIDSFQPEAVLLDISMPGMDGYEVAQRIRSQPGSADIMLIALTGWSQEEDRQRA